MILEWKTPENMRGLLVYYMWRCKHLETRLECGGITAETRIVRREWNPPGALVCSVMVRNSDMSGIGGQNSQEAQSQNVTVPKSGNLLRSLFIIFQVCLGAILENA